MGNASDSFPNAQEDASKASLVLNEQAIVALMQQLQHTREGQYSCTDSAELLDEYVDLVADAQDAALLMPLVKAHLDACPDCHQNYEILLDILKFEE